MTKYQGPSFQLVETITIEELEKKGGFSACNAPILVKGAVKRWPAWNSWTFNNLANLKNKDGTEIIARFQNGLIEQGVTKKPVYQPIAPYLTNLENATSQISSEERENAGLCPEKKWKNLKPKENFYLDWDYLKTFPANQVYLAQWHILQKFPELKNDFAIRNLWKGLRWTWEYVFMGPAHTVSGLHDDFGNNWFCQVKGLKEFILFSPKENDPYLCESDKYDWGARLSNVDITRVSDQANEKETFAKAQGLYARVEAGDALYIPKHTWHAVVALEPSISLAVFGLTIPEILLSGVANETLSLLHKMRVYKTKNCACHKMHVHTSKEETIAASL